jgi:hypothetical protein
VPADRARRQGRPGSGCPGYPRVAGALHVANGVLHVRSQAIAAIPEAIWNDDKTKRYRVSAGLLVAGRATLAG